MTEGQDHWLILKANFLKRHVKCSTLKETRQNFEFLSSATAEEHLPQRRPMVGTL